MTRPAASQTAFQSKKYVSWLPAVVILTILCYLPIFRNGFVNWDDNIYITDNPLIQHLNWKNIRHIFTSSFEGHYHPLTLVSLSLDYLVAGLRPWFFHAVNVFFHLVNTTLVFVFISKLTGKKDLALFAAALFGVHTLHVESVAWATARKDLLFTVFFLASLIQYLNYLKNFRIKYLIWSLGFFLLSVFSKGQAVSLVLVLPLVDYVRGRTLTGKKALLEKAPFLGIALLFGIITFTAQKATGYTAQGEAVPPLAERTLYAGYAYFAYLVRLLVPVNLSAYYPYPRGMGGEMQPVVWIYSLLTAGVLAAAWFFRKSRLLVFGLLFFTFNIAALLKFIPVSNYLVADRYTYLSSAGIFLLLGLGCHELCVKSPARRRMVAGLAVLYVLALGLLTFQRTQVWKNSYTLLDDVLKKHPTVVSAWNARGDVKADEGKYQEAIADFDQAIRLLPGQARGYNNRGRARFILGDTQGALEDFNRSLALDAGDPKAFNNRGLVWERMQDYPKARADYRQALTLKPDFAEALNNLGGVESKTGNPEVALELFNRAVTLRPGFEKAIANKGIALVNTGKFKEGADILTSCISRGFTDPYVFFKRGFAWYNLMDFKAAIADFDEAIRIRPDDAEAYAYRGFSEYNLDQFSKAVEDLAISLRYQPGFALGYAMKGLAEINLGMKEEGCSDLHEAQRLGLDQAGKAILKYCGK